MTGLGRGKQSSPEPGAQGDAAARAPEREGDWLEVGVVTRPHGVRGELRVRPHWAESESLDAVEELALVDAKGAWRRCRVRARRPVPGAMLLSLGGVESRDDAERLRGARVLVPRASLPALERGEMYLTELVGARVEDAEGVIGEVVEVRCHPSVDSVVIRDAEGRLLEQALAAPWLESVDAARRVVRLCSRDGLF